MEPFFLSSSSNLEQTPYQHKVFRKEKHERFTIMFGGDTSFGENYQEDQKEKGRESILEKFGYNYCLEKLAPFLSNADFVVLNLETPITNVSKSSFEGIKNYVHWAHVQKTPEALLENHVSLVTLANNHTFDYGLEGFEQTLDILQQYKLPYIGAGQNIQEARKPYIVEVHFGEKKFSFAFISAFEIWPKYKKTYKVYAASDKPGLMPLDTSEISETVKLIKRDFPEIFVVVLPHWGDNYAWHDADQKRIADELMSAGVDLILGTGSHMMQEFEQHHGKWVVYSMGNFAFNSRGRYKKSEMPPFSCAVNLEASVDEQQLKLELKLYPIMTNNLESKYQTRPINAQEWSAFREDVLARMTTVKFRMGSCILGSDRLGYVANLKVNNDESQKDVDTALWFGVLVFEKPNKLQPDIEKHLTRALTIQKELSHHNAHVLFYTPDNVNMESKTVVGYYLAGNMFATTTIKLPKINYDFYITSGKSTDAQKMSYLQFLDWAKTNGYDLKPTRAFNKAIGHKQDISDLLLEIEPSVVPKSALFTKKPAQVEQFFKSADQVFLKPNRGNKGDHIFVIKKLQSEYLITHYLAKNTEVKTFETLSQCLSFFEERANPVKYIIQEGIDVIQHQGGAVNLRVVLVHDGTAWQFMGQCYVASGKSQVSNAYQGATVYLLEDLLPKLISPEILDSFVEKLKKLSFKIADHLYQTFNASFEEIAFDYLIDKDFQIFVSEINVKPGLLGEPMRYDDIYHMTAQEKHLYEAASVLHGQSLARSFLRRYKMKYEDPKYWFDDLKSPLTLTLDQTDVLLNDIMHSIATGAYKIQSTDSELLQDTDPRILFLTIANFKVKAQIIQGVGNGLIQAINSALKYAQQFQTIDDVQALKFDLVQEAMPIKRHPLDKPLDIDRSLYGIAFKAPLYVACLPETLVCHTIVNSKNLIRPKNIIKHCDLSDKATKALLENTVFDGYIFNSESFYHSKTRTMPLFRGHLLYNDISPDLLLSASTAAGTYLQNAVMDSGKFRYEYYPKTDEFIDKYNILRHAGSIYAMLELYELTHDKALMASAERALGYLLKQTDVRKYDDESTLTIVENDISKLGANALAILAISKYISITKETRYLEAAQKMGLWIKHNQAKDGNFITHKQQYSTQEDYDFVSGYYPGETIFAMVRLYEVDKNPVWLEIAAKGANYIIHERDKGKSVKQLDHDHWLLYGLDALYIHDSNSDYTQHALKICEGILRAQHQKDAPLDYLGGFYDPPRSTPTSIRAEGLCAAYRLLSGTVKPMVIDDVLESIKRCIQFQLQMQFTPERSLYLPQPDRAWGGISKGLKDFSIRIDYVQHHLSSLIGLYRILKFAK